MVMPWISPPTPRFSSCCYNDLFLPNCFSSSINNKPQFPCEEFSFTSQKDFDLSSFTKLHSCKSVCELKQIHSLALKSGQILQTQQLLYTNILCSCATVADSTLDLSYIHTLFTQLHDIDVNCFNKIIRYILGFKSRSNARIVLLFYWALIEKGLVADNYTYPFVFKACTQLCVLRVGKMVHAHVVKNGFVLNLYVLNTLLRFYCVCGVLEDARKVLDISPQRDVVSWTTLIQGYVDHGFFRNGLNLFFDMYELGYRADEKTMVVVISACAKLRDLNMGNKLHDYISNHFNSFDVFVANALVDMYLKCGDTSLASKVFDEMPVKNVVSWNSMISGLAQKGDYNGALRLFQKMQGNGVKLDDVTLVAVLNSCSNLSMLEMGKWVHTYIKRSKIEADGIIGNGLIDLYAKCGNIASALSVYSEMKHRDVYTYTAMILGLAMHGEGIRALELFDEMLELGVEPNEVTFVGILTACSHVGLVEEGRKYFSDMSNYYNLKPQIEHYGCMVDLFSRIGLINEALVFIESMPFEPDSLIWGALLGGCRLHGEVELGESALNELARIADDEEDGAHVLMSNIYASANKWKDSIKIRKFMKRKKLRKSPGCSSIELDGVVHEFQKGKKGNSLDKILGH